jgi:hypothetical protein
MTDDIEQLGRLIACLPPAPRGWVAAAAELPRTWRELESILDRATVDAELRASLDRDLERVLADAGIVPSPSIVAEVRNRMRSY